MACLQIPDWNDRKEIPGTVVAIFLIYPQDRCFFSWARWILSRFTECCKCAIDNVCATLGLSLSASWARSWNCTAGLGWHSWCSVGVCWSGSDVDFSLSVQLVHGRWSISRYWMMCWTNVASEVGKVLRRLCGLTCDHDMSRRWTSNQKY